MEFTTFMISEAVWNMCPNIRKPDGLFNVCIICVETHTANVPQIKNNTLTHTHTYANSSNTLFYVQNGRPQ